MEYILHYDIAAFIIEITIAFLFCIRRNYPTAATKVYVRMLCMATHIIYGIFRYAARGVIL